MIQYVLTVSEFFPKTHSKAGQPTGFPLAIKHYDKIHTIRGNYELWSKRFEKINQGLAYLSVRIWTGKPYRSPQAEIFKYFKTHNIGLEKLEIYDFSYWVGLEKISKEKLALNDGLSLLDFNDWFKKSNMSKKIGSPKTEMAIIHFTGFRYCH